MPSNATPVENPGCPPYSSMFDTYHNPGYENGARHNPTISVVGPAFRMTPPPPLPPGPKSYKLEKLAKETSVSIRNNT